MPASYSSLLAIRTILLPQGSEGLPQGSEGLPKGSEGLPKGSEVLLEGLEGLPVPKGLPEKSEGLQGGQMFEHIDAEKFFPFYTTAPYQAAFQKGNGKPINQWTEDLCF